MLVCSVSFSEFLTLVGNEKTQEPSTDYLILAFKMFDRSVVFRCIKFAHYLPHKSTEYGAFVTKLLTKFISNSIIKRCSSCNI